MMFSLSMIVFFPLTGWLIDNLGFVVAFLLSRILFSHDWPSTPCLLGKMAKRIDNKIIP